MASLNKCMFIGNLTRDPEIKYMNSGEAVANCSIACNEQWKGKDGAKQERVEFVNLVFYRKLAEIAGEYLKKGSQVYVEGKLQTRKWEKDGVTRYSTEIIVNEMTMLGGKSTGGSEVVENQSPPERAKAPATKADDGGGAFDDMDSNLPF